MRQLQGQGTPFTENVHGEPYLDSRAPYPSGLCHSFPALERQRLGSV
jgi:hypothetical protein